MNPDPKPPTCGSCSSWVRGEDPRHLGFCTVDIPPWAAEEQPCNITRITDGYDCPCYSEAPAAELERRGVK